MKEAHLRSSSTGISKAFLSFLITTTPGKMQNKIRVLAHTTIAQVFLRKYVKCLNFRMMEHRRPWVLELNRTWPKGTKEGGKLRSSSIQKVVKSIATSVPLNLIITRGRDNRLFTSVYRKLLRLGLGLGLELSKAEKEYLHDSISTETNGICFSFQLVPFLVLSLQIALLKYKIKRETLLALQQRIMHPN